jgi:hypothetical protein
MQYVHKDECEFCREHCSGGNSCASRPSSRSVEQKQALVEQKQQLPQLPSNPDREMGSQQELPEMEEATYEELLSAQMAPSPEPLLSAYIRTERSDAELQPLSDWLLKIEARMSDHGPEALQPLFHYWLNRTTRLLFINDVNTSHVRKLSEQQAIIVFLHFRTGRLCALVSSNYKGNSSDKTY